MRGTLLLAGIVAAASCRLTPSPQPVPVQGAHEDVSEFSGDWTGRYWSQASGRHGTIRFNLPEHADTGYGEVEITFSPSLHLTREAAAVDYPKNRSDEPAPPTCTIIGIRVVRIEDGVLRGIMAPYWDPDCDCRAQTVFEGKLARNRVTGTFSTRRETSDHLIVTGEWRAERKR